MTLREAVLAFFTEDGWPHADTPVPDVFQTHFGGTAGDWPCLIEVREAASQVLVYSLIAERAPLDRLAEVAELITRINFDLPIGNIELDWNDGELRVRTSIDVEGSEPTVALIRQLVHANVSITDHHLPALRAACRNG